MTSVLLSCLLTIAAAPQQQIKPVPETVLVAANAEDRILYHLPGAAHLPASIRFIAVPFEEVKDTNIRPCPVCFPIPTPNVDDYEAELVLAYMVEREVRAQFHVLQTHPQIERVNQLGQKVLESWPEELKGYRYRFSILDTDIPNAFAIPTGFIYITTGLLDLIEADVELESILAHEIAHVEHRHGYTEFERAQRVGLLAELANVVLSATLDTDLSLLTTFASLLVFQGHSLDNEREADYYATRYLTEEYPTLGSFHFLSPLSKIAELTRDAPRPFLPTHPEMTERIRAVANAQSLNNLLLHYSGSVEQERVTGVGGVRSEIANNPGEPAIVELTITDLFTSPTHVTVNIEVSLSGWAEHQVVGFKLFGFTTQSDPQKLDIYHSGQLLETDRLDFPDTPTTEIKNYHVELSGEAAPSAIEKILRWEADVALQTLVLEVFVRKWESQRSKIRVSLFQTGKL
ncbi:M48 family metalloprotease [Gemmatimonadota bacterium]